MKVSKEQKLQLLEKRVKDLESQIDKLQPLVLKQINSFQKKITNIENLTNRKLQEPHTEICVKNKEGKWEEWSGIFKLSNSEKIEILLKRTEEHFKKHFNYNECKNKEFAIFKSVDGEKTIYKTFNKKGDKK